MRRQVKVERRMCHDFPQKGSRIWPCLWGGLSRLLSGRTFQAKLLQVLWLLFSRHFHNKRDVLKKKIDFWPSRKSANNCVHPEAITNVRCPCAVGGPAVFIVLCLPKHTGEAMFHLVTDCSFSGSSTHCFNISIESGSLLSSTDLHATVL